MTARTDSALVAFPTSGRLRDGSIELLASAGYRGIATSAGALVGAGTFSFIGMRPRDAAAALASGQLHGAFVSADIADEARLADLAQMRLGFAQSTLILAVPVDSGFRSVADLQGATIGTHLPRLATDYLRRSGVAAEVIAFGGSLEGLCAAGLVDAIVDLSASGQSLVRNGLRVLSSIQECEAMFVWDANCKALEPLLIRLRAAMDGAGSHYVMLHIAASAVERLTEIVHGLATPTLIPLDGAHSMVAAHLVIGSEQFWASLPALRAVGATGIVAVPIAALVP